jgi:hypothetical protein
MKTKKIVSFLAVGAVAVALLAVSAPAEADWHGGIGFAAVIVAPPIVLRVGHGALWRPWYENRGWRAPAHRWHRAMPYAAPVVVAPRPVMTRVFVRVPYPHWVVRPLVHRARWRRGY